MRGRLSIVAGLVVGVVAAGLLLGGIVALAPDGPAPAVRGAIAAIGLGQPVEHFDPGVRGAIAAIGLGQPVEHFDPGVRGAIVEPRRFGRAERCGVPPGRAGGDAPLMNR